MKYAINTLLWTAGFSAEHLPLIDSVAAHGFDGIEIARFDFDGFPAAEIRKRAEAAGIGTIFCSAFTGDQSFASADPDVRARSAEFLRNGIRATAEIGAKVFVGPYVSAVGYKTGKRRTEDDWKRAIEGLAQMGGRERALVAVA